MNTDTIKSIIKLFAISANNNENCSVKSATEIFKEFLDHTVEDKYIDNLLKDFLDCIDKYSSFRSDKKTSLNSVRIIRFCEESGISLSKKERFQVIFYLIFLTNNLSSDTKSFDFVKLVSECYGFSESEFLRYFDFITGEQNIESIELTLNNEKIADYLITPYKFIIFKPYISGSILINNILIKETKSYLLGTNSIVSYKKLKKYYFHELAGYYSKSFDDNIFSLKLEDVQVTKKKKVLLHKISLSFNSGELIGIIGKSGSGKTTLLKAIAGIENYSGQIIYGNGSNSKAFVSQANYFIPLFSVREHLIQRMDFLQIFLHKREDLLNSVLRSVGLDKDKEKISIHTDNTAYQLSGGQQKRLAIAMELITDPDILLLDEPTSGLASNDSLKIIELLKSIAGRNKSVIASIHQPDYETLMLFDKILIIDEFGYPVYFGSPFSAIEYFRNILGRIDKNSLLETSFNPSVLLNLIDESRYDESGNEKEERRLEPQFLYNKFLESNISEEKEVLSNAENCKNRYGKQIFFSSVVNHLKFSLKVDWKNKIRISLLLSLPLIMSIILSWLCKFSLSGTYLYYYNPNIPVWILIILISSVFFGLVSSGHEYIYLRQFHNSENLLINKNTSLLLSKIIKYLIFSFLQSVMLVFPSVLILKIGFHFFNLFFVVWLLVLWGNLVGLLLSSLFRSVTTVYLLIPLIIIPQMIFSGALIKFDNFNNSLLKKDEIPLLAEIMPLRWAPEAIITQFFLKNNFEKNFLNEKRSFYEAIYYLDFVIPAIHEVYSKDTMEATILFNNEFNDLQIKEHSLYAALNASEDIFKRQKLNSGKAMDHIYNSLADPESIMLRFTNKAVNDIIQTQSILEPYVIRNKKFDRKYMITYHISRSSYENNSFLIGVKRICKHYISTYLYNLIVISIFNVLFIVCLFVTVKLKKWNMKII
ncbi:MAG: ATP-binding cassette domain-containing protein [Bacteroidales bacterium]|jgi:ABC-type multidrug transport system ATPase subunit|nr:ATP-binding cassette domain-containing protein [Bacteroidales bacterium]